MSEAATYAEQIAVIRHTLMTGLAHNQAIAALDLLAVEAERCKWPIKPLKLVQVTLPDGTSAVLPPERAYFDSWSVQALENSLNADGVKEGHDAQS